MEAILGIVIGAMLAGVFGAWGAWQANKREHERWRKDRRYGAYLAFLQLVDLYQQKAVNKLPLPDGRKLPLALKELNEAVTQISLLGPERVLVSCRHLQAAVAQVIDLETGAQNIFSEARAEYITVTRHVLNINS